jgi:hypothetical protein
LVTRKLSWIQREEELEFGRTRMELGRWSIYQAEELEFGISKMELGRWSIS